MASHSEQARLAALALIDRARVDALALLDRAKIEALETVRQAKTDALETLRQAQLAARWATITAAIVGAVSAAVSILMAWKH
jgi:hypothetical protein